MHHARHAVGRSHTDSAFGDFGDIHVALRVEHQIVRRDDVAAHRADRLDRAGVDVDRADLRSEEHTSELQSLMRNSYAVFCLKKKTTNKLYSLIHESPLI